jgi:hypothetical protein
VGSRALCGRPSRRLQVDTFAVVPLECMLALALKYECDATSAYHIVHTAEDPVATVPLAHNAWVMLCLVPGKVFLAGEAAASRLRAARVAAEEGLCVPLVVLAQVAAPREYGAGGAAWVRAAPGTVMVQVAVGAEICCAGRG